MNEEKPILLIVDDAAEYLRSLEMVLRGHFAVRTAGTVEAAQASVREVCPDAALVDVCLDETVEQDRSGLDLVVWLKTTCPRLRVVVMSALEDSALPQRALDCGADAFVRKPVELHELKTVLHRALGLKS